MNKRHPRVSGRSVSLAAVLALACSHCGGDDASAGATSTSTTTTTDGGGGSGGSGEGGSGGSGPCATPVNGTIEATGSFDATLVITDANLDVPKPGKVPCAAHFDPQGGIRGGAGKPASGNLWLECTGAAGELYFGFNVDTFAKPEVGAKYPAGTASSVPKPGTSDYMYNGEATIGYEQGPRCDTKQDRSKAWTGQAGGSFQVDALAGTKLSFTLINVPFAPSKDGGLNYKGTGAFTLSGSGVVDVKGL